MVLIEMKALMILHSDPSLTWLCSAVVSTLLLLIFPSVDFILASYRRRHGSTQKASSGSPSSLREARSSSRSSHRGVPTRLVLSAGKAERIPRLGRRQQQPALGAAWRSWGRTASSEAEPGVARPARRRSDGGLAAGDAEDSRVGRSPLLRLNRSHCSSLTERSSSNGFPPRIRRRRRGISDRRAHSRLNRLAAHLPRARWWRPWSRSPSPCEGSSSGSADSSLSGRALLPPPPDVSLLSSRRGLLPAVAEISRRLLGAVERQRRGGGSSNSTRPGRRRPAPRSGGLAREIAGREEEVKGTVAELGLLLPGRGRRWLEVQGRGRREQGGVGAERGE
ncbi:unnamed protein product [Urochloa humidicola]